MSSSSRDLDGETVTSGNDGHGGGGDGDTERTDLQRRRVNVNDSLRVDPRTSSSHHKMSSSTAMVSSPVASTYDGEDRQPNGKYPAMTSASSKTTTTTTTTTIETPTMMIKTKITIDSSDDDSLRIVNIARVEKDEKHRRPGHRRRRR